MGAKQAMTLNKCLSSECTRFGINFIDCWRFYDNQPWLFIQDGIHLNNKGKNNLCEIIDELDDHIPVGHSFLE